MTESIDPRTAAYLAVRHYLKAETAVDTTLAEIRSPLARQIAYGTIQRLLSLDHLARQLTARASLRLKPAEKAILFTALYQLFFLSGSPDYAITNEMVELAKKECHSSFVRFLNALLRAFGKKPPILPTGSDIRSLSLFYSYPEILIQQLLKDYGHEHTIQILELGNQPAPTMARLRATFTISSQEAIDTSPNLVLEKPFPVITIDDPTTLALSSDAYIQNVTPVYLMGQLTHTVRNPHRILDLCAAPGGKLLLAHDLYPQAQLFANDISEKRLERLRQNLQRYQLTAQITCGPAEDYSSSTLFDLIILDVPCSNSGVLGKRPEARWRITEPFLLEIEQTQSRLLHKATQLLAPGGVIWYLTCSLLKRENGPPSNSLAKQCETTVLPTTTGWDGGYACAYWHTTS